MARAHTPRAQGQPPQRSRGRLSRRRRPWRSQTCRPLNRAAGGRRRGSLKTRGGRPRPRGGGGGGAPRAAPAPAGGGGGARPPPPPRLQLLGRERELVQLGRPAAHVVARRQLSPLAAGRAGVLRLWYRALAAGERGAACGARTVAVQGKRRQGTEVNNGGSGASTAGGGGGWAAQAALQAAAYGRRGCRGPRHQLACATQSGATRAAARATNSRPGPTVVRDAVEQRLGAGRVARRKSAPLAVDDDKRVLALARRRQRARARAPVN
jgi:hypothetical protein